MVKIGLLKSDANHMHRMKLMNTSEDAFIMSYAYTNEIVSITIESYGNSEDTFHDLCFMTEWCIKKYHPEKIIVSCDASLCKLMNAAGYYAKGKSFQHVIEPYRYLLDDHVFDEEGYIIDQGSMQSIPFGWFDTQRKGCGWIAVYNLLLANRKYTPMHEVIHDLEKHNLLGKVFGQEIFWLIVYLKQKGLDVFVSLPGFTGAMHAFQAVLLEFLHIHIQEVHIMSYLIRSMIQMHTSIMQSIAEEIIKKVLQNSCIRIQYCMAASLSV